MTTYYAPRLTIEGKLYVGSTPNSTAAVEATGIIGDITLSFAPSTENVAPRGSFLEMVVRGQVPVGIGFEMNWAPSDPAFTILATAWTASPIAGADVMTVRTKDYASGKGVDWDVVVTKFEKKDSKGKGQTVDVELKPTIGYRDPNANIYV